jgi:hypothetical protein
MTSPLQKSIFLDRLVCYLMPYFLPMTTTISLARADILETLDSYGARSRAELLTVVQIIAFSLSALDALMGAKADATLSPSLQLRFRGCANNLSRSSHQAEKSFAVRLKCDPPTAANTPNIATPNNAAPANATPDSATPNHATPNHAPPANATPNAPTEEILRRIDAQIAAVRTAQPPTKAQKRSAVFNTIFANPRPPPPN